MKNRADIILTELKLTRSRSEAADLIKSGKVSVNGKILVKPSQDISPTDDIKILEENRFVGRGGQKLEKALAIFKVDVKDAVAVDIGSSTGGFTDCLLKHQAKKVFAVDVGTDQLAPELRANPNVVVMEQTDIRKVDALPEAPDLAVIDTSFISLDKILPKAKELLKPDGKIIALVKPQFEVGADNLNKQGLVKSESLQIEALEKVKHTAQNLGLKIVDETESPILGGTGNKEFLLYLRK
ncbi:MAG: TlyA family RNA methyltransferase [bacterium]